MDEERSGKGLWIILFILALLAALTFGTLWFLRGSDIDRLNSAISANQAAADATATRLERELRTARNEVDSGNRKIAELETRVRDEQRRSTEVAQQVERRLRGDVDSANARVRDLTSQLAQLQSAPAEKETTPSSGQPSVAAAGIAAGAGAVAAALPLQAELEKAKQQLADARSSAEAREKELYQRLADAVKEKEELEGLLGDLKANASHIGRELTSAYEDLKEYEGIKEHADTLEKELAAAKAEVKRLEEKVAELTRQNEQLDSGHASLRKELAAAGVAAAGAGLAAAKISDLEHKLAEAEKNVNVLQPEAARAARLDADLGAAKKMLEELRGQVAAYETEQEKLRKDLSETNLNLQKAQADAVKTDLVSGELDAAKKTIADLHAQIGDMETTQGSLRKDLAAALTDLKAAQSGKDGAAPVAELEHRIAQLARDLDAAKKEKATADNALEKLRADLSGERTASLDREKTLRDAIAKLEKENRDAKTRLDDLQAKADQAAKPQSDMSREVDEALNKLEAKFNENTPDLRLRATAAQQELLALRKQLADATNEAAKARADAADELKKTRDELAQAKAAIAKLEEKIGDIEANNSSLRRELNSAAADLQTSRENAARDLTAARKEFGERLSAREKELRDRFEQEKAALQKAVPPAPPVPPVSETPIAAAPVLAEAAPTAAKADEPATVVEPAIEPSHYYLRDPDRSVGDILEFAQNGRYVVNIGARQGVKPGMVFDIHRPLGNMHWFIGALRVERTLTNTAEALTAPIDGVKICPVTGRAVLDPASKYSPFVYADNGKPVPLIPAESLGLGGEMPAAGDKIDNPFFDPARQMEFTLSPGIAERAVAKSIEAVGGKIVEPEDMTDVADYLVVAEENPENSAISRPRQVTPGQIASYSEQ